MRSSWSRVGPYSDLTAVFIREGETQKGERHVRTDTPGKCHVMTEAAAAGHAMLKTDSHQQVQQTGKE